MVLSFSTVRRVARDVVGDGLFSVVAVTGRGDSEHVEVVLQSRCDPSEVGPVVIATSRRTSVGRLHDVLAHLLTEHIAQQRPC